MRLTHRPQASWAKKPDNSQLVVECEPQKLEKARNFFSYGYEQNEEQFSRLYKYLGSPYQINHAISIVDRFSQLEPAINQLLKDQYVIVDVFDEKSTSYKGYASWILMANSSDCYLIDSLTLREHMKVLEEIMENGKIFKLMYNLQKITSRFKRDFGIFPINIFELFYISLLHPKLEEVQKQYKDMMRVEADLRPQTLITRPISSSLKKVFHFRLKMLIEFAKSIPQKPSQIHENIFQNCLNIYRRSNQFEQIQSPYIHRKEEPFNLDLPEGRFEKEQFFSPSERKSEKEVNRELSLYSLLIEFREHVGKMNDISVKTVIPNQVLLKICQAEKISVLEICHFYEEYGLNPGMEICQRIYEVTKLNEEKIYDEQMIAERIFTRTNKKQDKEKDTNTSLKKLLKQIEWGDSSQWLNRKDDPSIKLYKEIISVDEFDHSIGQEFLQGMKSDIIKKQDLGKFLKYAQYMRNKNVEKLREYIARKQKEEKEEENQRQTFFGKKDEDDDSDEDSSFIVKKKPVKGASRALFDGKDFDSSTSLQGKFYSKDSSMVSTKQTKSQAYPSFLSKESVQPNVEQKFENTRSRKSQVYPSFLSRESVQPNVEQKSENTRSRKSSETESMRISELDQMEINRADIKPLPNNLEEIYSLAQEVKKKADKKTSKKDKKKQGKESSKDVQFVPTWQDIQKALYMDNNLN